MREPGRELDRRAEAGLGVRAAGDAQLAGHGGPGVLEVDGDREPRALPDVALEQRPGGHRGPVARRRPRSRPATRRRAGAGRPPTSASSGARGRDGCGAAALGLLDLGQGGGRSHDARRPRKSCTVAPIRGAAAPSGGRPTAPIVRCSGPRSVGAPLPRRRIATVHAPRGLRARHQTLPCPPLRPGDGGGPGPGRRPAVRRRSARTSTGRCWRATRATPSGWTCPLGEPGEDPDDRYRRAARTLTAWRSDGTLRKDPRPSVYVYEQTYRVPGTDVERTQRGFFARLRIEPFGPGSVGAAARADAVGPEGGPLPPPARDRASTPRRSSACTRTRRASGDRRARPRSPRAAPSRTSRTTTACATACGSSPTRARARAAALLVAAAAAGPVFIADGHHRYETAVRYRDERRTASTEQDPAFDFLLMLFLDAADQLTVLPTHRVVRGLGDGGRRRARRAVCRELFDVTAVAAESARGPVRGGRRAGRRRGPVRARDARRAHGCSRRGARRSPR